MYLYENLHMWIFEGKYVSNTKIYLINMKIVQLIFIYFVCAYAHNTSTFCFSWGGGFLGIFCFVFRKQNLQHNAFFVFKYNFPQEKTEIFAYLFNIAYPENS